MRERQAALATAVAEVQARVDELAGRQAELEERIAASAARRHALEERMRSGAVTASKDLQAMDHEVGQLAERQRGLEDEELVLMEEQEPLDAELAAPPGHGGRTGGRGGPPDRRGGGVRGRPPGGHRGRGGRAGRGGRPGCPPSSPNATSASVPTWVAWARPDSSATAARDAT